MRERHVLESAIKSQARDCEVRGVGAGVEQFPFQFRPSLEADLSLV